MNRQEKMQFVNEMNAELKNVDWAFLVDFRGLNVEQVSRLRKSIRENNSKYRVVKNTLARLAIKETPLEVLTDEFQGPVAVAWTEEDPIALAKVLVDFSKETKKLHYKSGIVSGKVLTESEFEEFSKLPGREELLAQLVYVISSPIRGFATALNEINAGFVRVLAEIQKTKE